MEFMDNLEHRSNLLSIPTKNPKVAVVGSGYWGKNLVRNFYQIGALKVICDKDTRVLEQFKDQYPQVETCVLLNDALSRDDIDGIVIATPAETHYKLAREALFAGKHVYVEKPLVLHEEEGADLIRLAEGRNLVLMVGHLLQYHPVFLKLKELAFNGDLGRINYIYSHRLNLGKIRREENILWSFAPHDISMILTLAGDEPESIVSTGGNYLHRKISDITSTHMEFDSGLRAHIFVSWLHPYKEQKLVVVGDQKMAVFDDTKQWQDKLIIYPHKIMWEHNIPIPKRAEAERIELPEDEPLALECKHFLNCIKTGAKPFTDGDEGLRVLKILNASQASLDGNGSKVYLGQKNKEASVSHINTVAPLTQTKVAINTIEPIAKSNDYFMHPSAVIDDSSSIGQGTRIWHFSHVLKGSIIGENCNIGQNVVIGPDVIIGKKCKIQNNVSVYKGVTLEDKVFCGPSMVFTNINNPRAELAKMDQIRPTMVKEGATIGANATIVCGVILGRYCFVGAGTVVTKNIPDYALVVGNPARQIGWMCECGERLTDDLVCLSCSKKYQGKENRIEIMLQIPLQANR